MKIFFFLIAAMALVIPMLFQVAVGSTTSMNHIVVPKSLRRDTNLALEKQHLIVKEGNIGKKPAVEIDATGSSLPDCSHACGPCFPCKRVTISFKCSISEPCPVVYRCLCKGRFFHVPSN